MANALDIIRGTAKDTLGLLTSTASELRQGFSLFQTWQLGMPVFPKFRYMTYADQYAKNELVFACIREVATSVSEAPGRIVVSVDGVPVLVENHPAMELLNHPNDVMTGQDFWEAVLTVEMISGNCYVWKDRDNLGRPEALWILRPDWVKFVPMQPLRRSVYQYSPGGQFDSDSTIVIPFTDMIHFKHGLDPLNMYGEGLSPVRVALVNTLLDNDATNFFRTVFTNSGIPSGLIKIKRRLQNQGEANRIMKRWAERYSGVTGWNRPAVLDEDAEYEQLGMDFRQMMADAIRDVPESRICMAFGVPPILVGAHVGLKRSTYTNYGSAKTSFWDETLSPLYSGHALKINMTLLAIDYPTDIEAHFEFDLSNVRALREDTSLLWKRATAALNAGGLTQNMFLQEIGKEPVPGGDVFLVPPGRTTAPAAPANPSNDDDDEPAQITEGATRRQRRLLRELASDGYIEYHRLFNVSRSHQEQLVEAN